MNQNVEIIDGLYRTLSIILTSYDIIRFRDLFTVMQTCKYAFNHPLLKRYMIQEAIMLRKKVYEVNHDMYRRSDVVIEIVTSYSYSIKWYERKLLIELEKRLRGRERFENKYGRWKSCRRKECYGNYYCSGIHVNIPRHCRFHLVIRWHEDIVPIKYSI